MDICLHVTPFLVSIRLARWDIFTIRRLGSARLAFMGAHLVKMRRLVRLVYLDLLYEERVVAVPHKIQ